MATHNMAYDHPAYTVPVTSVHVAAAGANGVASGKFIAYTAMILKSATVAVITAGTSAGAGNGVTFKAVTAQGVTTTSIGVATLGTGTAGVSTNVTLGNVALAQGEYVTITNGTDATGAAVVAFEALVTPGASVTL